MPLVFVHGVATRQKPEYVAEVAQRDALFRHLVLHLEAVVLNPDWGSHGVTFTSGLPWLPKLMDNEALGVRRPAGAQAGLSDLAQRDVAEAVDLAVAASLDAAIEAAAIGGHPQDAVGDSVELCTAAAAYLEREDATERKVGVGALNAGSDEDFLHALSQQLRPKDGVEEFGPFDALQRGLDRIEDWVVNAVSDGALSLGRRPGSAFAARSSWAMFSSTSGTGTRWAAAVCASDCFSPSWTIWSMLRRRREQTESLSLSSVTALEA